MSQDIVPFKMNFGSFVISSLIMMAVVLLFLGSSRKHWWWKKIAASMETLYWNEIANRFWIGGYGIWCMMRGRVRNNDNRTMEEGVELPTAIRA
jgi:hypothetical protein